MKQLSIFVLLILVFEFPSRSQENPVADRSPDLEYLAAEDSAGYRSPLKMPVSGADNMKLPYPIIFIHGLNSNSNTWLTFTNKLDSQFGLTYGGRLDYCLNFDLQNTSCNTQFGIMAGGADDLGTFASTLVPGDYYFVNFDVGSNGSFHPNGNTYDVLSNQSAIAKQGVALKHAIQQVMQTTGRNNVILMGHSMGGLAAREYLQNTFLWQADGQHHIAKLVTTGTPHGGSNTTAYGFGIGGINEQSEAVRDLRATYYYSKDQGVYLWGGLEFQSSTNMYDNLHGFYNADVNCNGASNETIKGLNTKALPLDLSYASIVGLCSGCLISSENGDGIVSAVNAELKNIYPVADIHQFYYAAYATTEIHTSLPDQLIQNLQGLDEPNALNLAYEIEFEKKYTAFTTEQSDSTAIDNDAFTFEVREPLSLSLYVKKTDVSDLIVDLYDSGYNKVCKTIHSKGQTEIHLDEPLDPGKYYLLFWNKPNSKSYQHPYTFILNNTIHVGIDEKGKKQTTVYPNPVAAALNIRSEIYHVNEGRMEIFNSVGEKMMSVPFSPSIDVSQLASGMYMIKITQPDTPCGYFKFIKQ
jgi:pimeloyl-ACP methyl ester carboxylesterase